MTKHNDQERALFERWLSERDALLLNMRERPLEPVLAWLEEIDALVSAAAQQIAPYHDPRNGAETWAVPEIWREAIDDTLRYYRMSTLEDGEGCGYPLIDAMTADGQSVAGGIEECRYLADALVDALASAPHPVSDLPTCEIAQVADLAGLIVSDVCDLPPEDDGADCVRVNVNDLIAIIKRHLAPHPVSGEHKPERCQYQRGTIECRGDGYLWDADCDGYDPADHSMPCPSCNPVDYLEQAKEEAESTVDFASMGTRGTGEDIWLWAVERVRHECPEGVDAALAKVGQVLALVPAENDEGGADRLHNAPPAAQDVTGLAEALEAIVKHYPNPDISHVDYRVRACKQAEHALAAYRSQAQGGDVRATKRRQR